MKLHRLVAHALSLACLSALCPVPGWAADVPEAGLRRCRAISDGAARLACYDALAGAAPVASPLAQAAPAPTPASAAAASAAGVPGGPVSPLASAPAPAQPAVRPPEVPTLTLAQAESSFGLETVKGAVQSIVSSIPGLFEGWDQGSRIRLANGQVWQVTDGSTAALYLRDPRVKVERAALASYRLEIEGVRSAPRVQRVE